ncbi:NADPH-dependent 7-cyano-7-deazaguanine reductase QueF [Endozoicomonas sp. OPT23]|uniref:NADPH-dependent 7-cyano-7-deazaguanine reductase QueF n=1 Tax=Endozoicomonas sp. OPT23 TaxID=2072845 RepID=UPI00129BB2EC|nr:NADPH-dependent 7-cyano-7-deazaguanine reductase QueF [Endozoicomonas sp. OPT23]MRI32362.1 NADPH-dependent 7-cyano-7-deazaguanine reductase QueF [Endozoicomonas sp. OPT23]
MSELVNASPLGKVSEYQTHYNPELLFPIPRKEKQKELGLDPEDLPFVGSDVWFAYELSWLNSKGKPLAMVGRFELPCNSPSLIESKSFKLYLNSFNQSAFDSVEAVQNLMVKDLSAAAGATVGVKLMTIAEMESFGFHHAEGVEVDQLDISIDCYDYSPDLLQRAEGQKEEVLVSHLLKSNCPVTGQPDWGTVVVEYKGQAIDHESFLRFICSFRGHQEFHEQCVERVFTEIRSRFEMEELTVYARYVRRGGLDINPWRSTHQAEQKDVRLIRQ